MRIFVQSKKMKLRILFAGLLVSAFLTGCGAEEESRKNDRNESSSQTEQSVATTEQLSGDNEKAKNETKNESTENVTEKETAEAPSEPQSEPSTADESGAKQEKMSEYVEMLQNFAESGEWKNHCEIDGDYGADPSQCNELEYSIFDIDGNGIPEMLVYAGAPHTGFFNMSMSCFCVIENDEISVVLSGDTVDGSMGGRTVSMVRKKDTGELQIVSHLQVGGFGGKMYENSFYSYNNGSLQKELCIKSTTYFDTNNDENEYLIDEVAVTSDEIDRRSAEYEWINISEISSYTEVY